MWWMSAWQEVRQVESMDIVWVHLMMVSWCMVLGEIITKIEIPWCPVNVELLLVWAISDPIEAHVHGTWFLLFNCVVDYTTCSWIVCLYWCGQSRSCNDCHNMVASLPLTKSAPSLASAADDITCLSILQTVCMALLWRVGEVGRGVLLRKKWPPARLCASASVKYDGSEWTCSIMSLAWYHTFGIWVGCTVIEKLCDGFRCSLGAFCLCWCDGAQGNSHGRVYGLSIKQESTDYLLNTCDIGSGKFFRIIYWKWELLCMTICGQVVWLWCVHQPFRRRMLEFVECRANAWRGWQCG